MTFGVKFKSQGRRMIVGRNGIVERPKLQEIAYVRKRLPGVKKVE